jgi:hypothetical protein
MPWYKAGTVSVAQNSNTVKGSNTSFIANSRVGDAFIGPDGELYEVTNIASDTAMSISPNYQGATNAAGGYALAPLQGYVKESADALRSLVNQFGSVLAVLGDTGTPAGVRNSLQLGTVATEDTVPVIKGGTGATDAAGARIALGLATPALDAVPVAKGGTGGTDQATARTGLGLGSVAVENIVPAAKGGTGNATGTATRLATAAMVGAVSQSGGVPTGAIIEQGANGNGRYVRFADGTQICWTRRGSSTGNFYSIAAGSGGILYGSDAFSSPFAMPFVGIPTVNCSIVSNQAQSELCFPSYYSPPTESSFGGWRLITTTPNATIAVGFYLNLVAVGRWY